MGEASLPFSDDAADHQERGRYQHPREPGHRGLTHGVADRQERDPGYSRISTREALEVSARSRTSSSF